MLGRKGTSLLRLTGLRNHGFALGRAVDIERTTALKPLALKIDFMDFSRISKGVSRAVHHHRVFVPAVPQAVAQVEVLIGPLIALSVV